MAGASRRISLEQRSVFAGIRGIPGWAAILGIVAFVLLSYALAWNRVLLGRPFTILFFAGCLLAVLIVQRKSLFWAAVVPPIIAAVMIPLFYFLTSDQPDGVLSRAEMLTVLVPLAKRFPLILCTWLIVLAIAIVRGFVLEPSTTRAPVPIAESVRSRIGLNSSDRTSHRSAAEVSRRAAAARRTSPPIKRVSTPSHTAIESPTAAPTTPEVRDTPDTPPTPDALGTSASTGTSASAKPSTSPHSNRGRRLRRD